MSGCCDTVGRELAFITGHLQFRSHQFMRFSVGIIQPIILLTSALFKQAVLNLALQV